MSGVRGPTEIQGQLRIGNRKGGPCKEPTRTPNQPRGPSLFGGWARPEGLRVRRHYSLLLGVPVVDDPTTRFSRGSETSTTRVPSEGVVCYSRTQSLFRPSRTQSGRGVSSTEVDSFGLKVE